MHMANELISMPVAAGTIAAAAGGLGWLCRKARSQLLSEKAALMGILGAFVFAAQMVNFQLPLMPGTSGHLIGAVFLSVVLGPALAAVVLSSVVIVQCLLFQDGGLLALGANIFNMGIVASFSSYYLYRLVVKFLGDSRRSQLVSGFVGAWASVFLASIFCAVELAVSGASPIAVVLPTMAGIHAFIGIGEGLITGAALGLVLATRADLLQLQKI